MLGLLCPAVMLPLSPLPVLRTCGFSSHSRLQNASSIPANFLAFKSKALKVGLVEGTHITFLNVSIRAGIWDLWASQAALVVLNPPAKTRHVRNTGSIPQLGRSPGGGHALYPTSFLCPWNFPGKNTGVGCHFLLQGLFLTQGSNLSPSLAGGLFTTSTYMLISTVWFGSEAREDHRRNLAGGAVILRSQTFQWTQSPSHPLWGQWVTTERRDVSSHANVLPWENKFLLRESWETVILKQVQRSGKNTWQEDLCFQPGHITAFCPSQADPVTSWPQFPPFEKCKQSDQRCFPDRIILWIQ